MSYGKVKDTFWTDKKIGALSDDAKLLALYLMTGPHRNILGCMRIPDGYLVADLGWPSKRLADAISMLCGCGFICRDDDGWTLILNQLKHDPVKVKNHALAAIRLAGDVPTDSVVYQQLVPRLTRALDDIGMASAWHPDAVAIPEPSPLPEPEPSTANAVSAPDDAPSPPSALKSQVFGPCLDWLAEQTGKDARSLRSAVGAWCRDYGDGPVVEAMMAAQRASPVEPVAYINRLLKSGGPRDGPHSQARQAAAEDEVDRMILEAAREADRRTNDQQQRADYGAVEPLELGFRAPNGEDHQRPAEPEVRRSGGGLRGIATALPALGTGGRH